MEEFAPCSICMRTLLVGEGITTVGNDQREELVCDLCIAKPRARALGEQLRRERVKSAAGAANVQRIYPKPIPARREATEPARAV